MQQYLQNKKGLVESVFDKVYDRYDLMNDFMSLGIHRVWKKSLINMMAPSVNKKLVDVACGTGDIGKLFLDKTYKKSKVTSVDPNKKMISQGKINCQNILIFSGLQPRLKNCH
jgi:Methylase involved in ubiquinone/menaquinone biosynthesis